MVRFLLVQSPVGHGSTALATQEKTTYLHPDSLLSAGGSTLGHRTRHRNASDSLSLTAFPTQVLVFDTTSLVEGGAAAATPLATVAVSSSDSGDSGDLPPRALSWGRPKSSGDNDYLLLVVRADRTAAVARIGGGGGGRGGSSGRCTVEDVAEGQKVFTAGCWLGQGRGRLAMGTRTGDLEVYVYGEGGGDGGGGGGLRDCEAVVCCPPELGMDDADAEVLVLFFVQPLSALFAPVFCVPCGYPKSLVPVIL